MANSVFGRLEQVAYQEAFLCVLDAMLDRPDEVISAFSMIASETRERLLSLGSGEPATVP